MTDDVDPIAHVRHLPIMEQHKYAQARWVWPRRNEMQPNKTPNGGKETWSQWFERLHHQKLLDYVEFCKASYEKPPRHPNQEPSHAD